MGPVHKISSESPAVFGLVYFHFKTLYKPVLALIHSLSVKYLPHDLFTFLWNYVRKPSATLQAQYY